MQVWDISDWQGMSTIIQSEKKSPYLVEKQINLEVSRKLGALVKRKGYKSIISSGLTALKSMIEFVDKNAQRILFLQDGTGVKESVYSGGYTDPPTAPANDESENTAVYQAYPVIWQNELRTGTGINATGNVPVWFGYVDEKDWFNGAVTVPAGKYLANQYAKWPRWTGEIGFTMFVDKSGSYGTFGVTTTEVGSGVSAGKASGTYIIFGCPVYDGYQRGLPQVLATKNFTASSGMSIKAELIALYTGTFQYLSKFRSRLTAVDIFVSWVDDNTFVDSDLNEEQLYANLAYFLERIDMNDDGETIIEKTATFQAASPPTYIEFDDDFSGWETFNMEGFYAEITGGSVDETLLLGTRTENTTKVRYAVSSAEATNSGDAVTVRVFSRWQTIGSNQYKRPFVYDDFYKKLGSEMYTRQNIPAGDIGLSDFRYKFSVMAGHYYVIAGVPDVVGGYFSVVDSPDVIPSQNVIRTSEEPQGLTSIGEDALFFLPKHSTLVQIYGNESTRQEEIFMPMTAYSQKAFVKLGDYEIYGFDAQGPWRLQGKSYSRIGDHMREWWEENLTEAQKQNVVVTYDKIYERILFSFPDYTDTDFTSGIVLVYDLKTVNISNGSIQAWWLLKTDVEIKQGCLSQDNHLLTGNDTEIVDWNNASPDESVDTLVLLNLLRSRFGGIRKVWLDWCNITKDGSDDLTVKIYKDGSATATDISSRLTDNDRVRLRMFLKKAQLELSTAASTNTFTLSIVQVPYNERPY